MITISVEKRNDNYEGSVRKRSDGRYEGRICIDGRRKSVYGKSAAEVKRKMREHRNKTAAGFITPMSITLNDYIEHWLTTYKWNVVEDSSYDKLERVWKNQIYNTIGKKKIGAVKTKDIQELINNHANPKDSETKALAYSGLQRIMHLLNPCYEMAIKEKVLSENPCRLVTLPRRDTVKVPTKKQFSLSDTQLQELKEVALSTYKNGNLKHRDGLFIMIMVNTGLRVGEMLALTWEDVDLDNRILWVNKTIQSNLVNRSGKGNRVLDKLKDGTKTSHGVRVFPLNDTIVSYFEMLKEDNLKKNITANYICSTRENSRQNARNLQRALTRIQNSTTIQPHISLHTLRHTFGSTLIRNGIDVSVVSSLMGHASIKITYDKYIHVLQEQKALAMKINSIA